MPHTNNVVRPRSLLDQNAEYERRFKMLLEGAESDFTIDCQGEIHHVHQEIISQVAFFAAAATNGFKETHEAKIYLPEDDPDAVRYMVTYLYLSVFGHHWTAEANCLCGGGDFCQLPLELMVEICILADKYGLAPLARYTCDEMELRDWAATNDALLEAIRLASDFKQTRPDLPADQDPFERLALMVISKPETLSSYLETTRGNNFIQTDDRFTEHVMQIMVRELSDDGRSLE
ncbi:MAG: hypothetical protein M1814_001918 [Vezdaea aestivalis]|nr:MAG: hypothetical protein M1814_001918 [Vezdaea aestivalis]